MKDINAHNGDLSTSPGTTDESPASLEKSDLIESGGEKVDFWSKYERLSKMIENISTVLSEYDMEEEVRSEREIELERLSNQLRVLRLELEKIDSKKRERDVDILKKAICDTRASISKVGSVECELDKMMKEYERLDEDSEFCRDLELDIEYFLLKSSCDKRIQHVKCYQRAIDDICEGYEHDPESRKYSAVGGANGDSEKAERSYCHYYNTSIENPFDKYGESNVNEFRSQLKRNESDLDVIRSILGERELSGERDYLLELLRVENEIQGDILTHICKVMGVSFD